MSIAREGESTVAFDSPRGRIDFRGTLCTLVLIDAYNERRSDFSREFDDAHRMHIPRIRSREYLNGECQLCTPRIIFADGNRTRGYRHGALTQDTLPPVDLAMSKRDFGRVFFHSYAHIECDRILTEDVLLTKIK